MSEINGHPQIIAFLIHRLLRFLVSYFVILWFLEHNLILVNGYPYRVAEAHVPCIVHTASNTFLYSSNPKQQTENYSCASSRSNY